jgi:hypothetical protein
VATELRAWRFSSQAKAAALEAAEAARAMREQLCADEGYGENDGEDEEADDLASSTVLSEVKPEIPVFEPAAKAMAATDEHGAQAETEGLTSKPGRSGSRGHVRGRGRAGRGKQHNNSEATDGGKDSVGRSRPANVAVEMGVRCIVPASEFGVVPQPGELDHYVGEVSNDGTLP